MLKIIYGFYLFCFLNGIVLLLIKLPDLKKSKAIRYYFFNYLVLLVTIGEFAFVNKIWQLPFYCYPDMPVRFLFSPFVFLYTATYLDPAYKPSRTRLLILFGPALLEIFVFIGFCIYFSIHHYPVKERVAIANGTYYFIRTSLAILFNLAIAVTTFKRITKFSKGLYNVVSNFKPLNFLWIRSILYVSIALWYFWLVLFVMELAWSGSSYLLYWMYFPLYVTLALVVLIFGYFAAFKPYLPLYYLSVQKKLRLIKKPPVEEELEQPGNEDGAGNKEVPVPEHATGQKDAPGKNASGSNTTAAQLLFEKIELLLKKEQLYKNPHLDLNTFATRLDSNVFNISQAIRTCSPQSNFYKYINTYRLWYFIELLQNKEYDIYTLQTLGQMAGFNSKTTLNKYCVAITGYLPAVIKNRLAAGSTIEEILENN
ncbi:hypothetical protein [Ferruginibacter sp.]